MICIDAMSTLCGIVPHNDSAHSVQVLESYMYEYTARYELQWCNVDFGWDCLPNDSIHSVNFVTLPLGSTASMFAF